MKNTYQMTKQKHYLYNTVQFRLGIINSNDIVNFGSTISNVL